MIADAGEAMMREHLYCILRDLPKAAEMYRDWFE